MGVMLMAGEPAIDVESLRGMIRHLQTFTALFQDQGIDTVTDHLGRQWSLWDIKYLYEQSQSSGVLPERQSQAIHMFLYSGQTEEVVAQAMGIKANNPVGQYATRGLETIVALALDGAFPRYRADREGS